MFRIVSRTATASLQRGVSTSNNTLINNKTCPTKTLKPTTTTKYRPPVVQQQFNRNISTLHPSRLYNTKPLPRVSPTSSLQRQQLHQQQRATFTSNTKGTVEQQAEADALLGDNIPTTASQDSATVAAEQLHDLTAILGDVGSKPGRKSKGTGAGGLQNMKAIKLLQPATHDVRVGETQVESYFVVGVKDCPGIKFIQEAMEKFYARFPDADLPRIHYCYYSPIQYDVRRIEILQQTRHLPHQLKTSPVAYTSDTNLILPEIISNGLDRGAWPHVFLGNHIAFIEHIATRIAQPEIYTTASAVAKAVPKIQSYEKVKDNAFSEWTELVLTKYKDKIHRLPPQNQVHIFQENASRHTGLALD